MHTKTHTYTCSYTQTGHFPGALHNNIHQWEEGNRNGLDWYRLLAERCWKFHIWWRKQLDTKKRRTAGKPATGQRTMRWSTLLPRFHQHGTGSVLVQALNFAQFRPKINWFGPWKIGSQLEPKICRFSWTGVANGNDISGRVIENVYVLLLLIIGPY